MTVLEFVVFDAHGTEIDWYDPLISYIEEPFGWQVQTDYDTYIVIRPEGGRCEVRPRSVAQAVSS